MVIITFDIVFAFHIFVITIFVLCKCFCEVQSAVCIHTGQANAFSFHLMHVREISATQLNSWSVEFRKIYFCSTWKKKYPHCLFFSSFFCVQPYCWTFDQRIRSCVMKSCVSVSWKGFIHYRTTWKRLRNILTLWNTKPIGTNGEFDWLFVISETHRRGIVFVSVKPWETDSCTRVNDQMAPGFVK